MRLSVNLDPDLYAIAKALAQAEDCSLSAAVNRLLRRALPGGSDAPRPRHTGTRRRNRLIVSRGAETVTAETVRHIQTDDDA